ncbi:MAG: hypothetical protein AAF829_01440, partial [Pseudomonadota bacterium]
MYTRFHMVSVLPAVLVSGCIAVPPAPEPPSLELSAPDFDNFGREGLGAAAINADWWLGFEDPLLSGIINAALTQNRDLEVALADIQTARALLAAEDLEQTPSTASTAAGEFGQAARDGADAQLSANGQIGASWEYDAFGRVDALIAAAEAGLGGEIELRRDLAVTVAADTALAYAELRG